MHPYARAKDRPAGGVAVAWSHKNKVASWKAKNHFGEAAVSFQESRLASR